MDKNDGIIRGLVLLLAIFAIHVMLMVYFESMSISDSVWLTLTTATTTGYGDISAQTSFGRFATIILLYGVGIYLTAKIAGDYIESRAEKRRQKIVGSWRRWGMKDHVVIINSPKSGSDVYFKRLVSQLRKDTRFVDTPIHLLTHSYPNGLPDSLKEMGVTHFTGTPDSEDSFRAVNISTASTIIVLAEDEYDGMYSDALTFDILSRLNEYGAANAQVIVESVSEENRERMKAAGAESIVRPVRAYPEVIVRTMVTPGSEIVLENLFKHEGDHQRRYDFNLSGVEWGGFASSVMLNGYGTPLAYVDKEGGIVCNPDAKKNVQATGVILMVREGREPELHDLMRLV